MWVTWMLAFPVLITALSCPNDVKISEQTASKIIHLMSERCIHRKEPNATRRDVKISGQVAGKIIDHLSERCNCKDQDAPTTTCRAKRPADCGELDKNSCKSGVYKIYPKNTSGFEVYCEMEKNGGGWTVFQRRMDGTVDFYRKWDTYRRGFGNPEKEFWLGNEHLHRLTAQGKYNLRINLEDFDNNEKYATYKQFAVGDTKSVYKLTIGGYQGDAGDSMARHNGQRFSAKDKDVDTWSSNCAQTFKGGWWYKDCHNANLNGLYLKGKHKSFANGVNWKYWKGHYYSLKGTTMMVRRE